ncbi:MurR/RpiR family transcriptional regulator [Sinomonas sp. ASV322]|uniref:MurR/RpiR family transcriptional regulator n=1 Tax=Sinomonas sp. ASV322 TaxID=3041920 RepID=UPI0027DAEABE|nr:MurR/RpiR family transcriptional regulator [Sinomonas sp. ASV322]MDQ4504386.1 MurR/RpiR family transcriptional regulator [Sinomonas sp. ASV322]
MTQAQPAPAPAPEGSWLGDALPPVRLTKAQSRVVDALVLNPKLASYADLSEIAAKAEVNGSSVVRTAQALGYRGWPDLQRELRARYLVHISATAPLTHLVEVRSPVHDSLLHDVENLREAVESIDPEAAQAAVDALCSAKRILVVAQGSYAAPAVVLAHLAATMGYPATFEGRSGVHLASAVSSLGPGDVLVVVHLWRSLRQLVTAARRAKEAGATVIAITDLRFGPVARASDHALIVPSEGVYAFQSATAATSVAYGLLAGMEAKEPERVREGLERTSSLWRDFDLYEA